MQPHTTANPRRATAPVITLDDLSAHLRATFTAFCKAHGLNLTEAVAEAIADHMAAIDPATARDDDTDDLIADAVMLWLDAQEGEIEFGIYYQLSPEGHHASGNEAAPPPEPQMAPQYPARDCPQECPGGVVS